MQSSAKPQTTQRRVILVRHAKAVEDEPTGDHARPLQGSGVKDAIELASWMQDEKIKPALVLCSTATRTRQTLDKLGRNLPTILSDKLYLASTNEMLALLQQVDDAVTEVMIVGHNPGIHGLLASLVHDYVHEDDADRMIAKFPTTACAVLSLDVPHWKDVSPASATLERLRY